MKRVYSIFSLFLLTCFFTACGGAVEREGGSQQVQEEIMRAELTVVTTFAGYDGNAANYREYYKMWEEETGNTVIDMSSASNSTFKARVLADFATNSEPDVLFFFSGMDADSFIRAGKVVSIEEIRAEYPDYAGNMLEERLPVSTVDGKKYLVPKNGYWEALFVNRNILEKSGVAMPGADYTWEQFLKDCENIKNAGYTPIAAALGHVPHYWWELSIYNHTGPDKHLTIPESVDTEIGRAWVAGLNDIKALYEEGYFPYNTLSASEDEAFTMFMNGRAAFMLEGSWRVKSIIAACQTNPNDPSTLDESKLSQFDVTYFPGTSVRRATDLIGGISMGYYITRKAWDDPVKREAAVSFVSHMTRNEVVFIFSQFTLSALKDMGDVGDMDAVLYNELHQRVKVMSEGITLLTEALQDTLTVESREPTFSGIPDIVTGRLDARDAVAEGLRQYHR